MNNKNLKFSSSKLFLLLILLSVFIFPLVSAVEIDMKSNYSQGETLIARFSGDFINQITPNNVAFYHVNTPLPIPIIYNVAEINGDFYIYALLTGKTEGNYLIDVHGVGYYQGASTVPDYDDIIENFTISNETADFSVTPGFVTTNGTFYLTMQNLQNNGITINYGAYNASTSSSGNNFFDSFFGMGGSSNSETVWGSITINSGHIQNVSFSSDNFSSGLNTFELSSGNTTYFIPVYLNINNSSQESNGETTGTVGTNENGLEFEPSSVNVSMPTSSTLKPIIYFTNTGNETISNILFSIPSNLLPYVLLSPNQIVSMAPGVNQKIEIDLASPSQEGVVNGEIIAYSQNSSSPLNLTLNFINGFVSNTTNLTITTCSDTNGTICSDTQTCIGQTEDLNDGVCCLGICQDQTTSSSLGSIIGWGLLVLLIIIIYIFYKKKYKNVPKKKPF